MIPALLLRVLLGADTPGVLRIVAVDPYGRPVEATWTLEGGTVLAEKEDVGQLYLPSGHYRMAITAPGFFGTFVEFDVVPGEASEVQAVMKASLVTLTDRQIVIHDKIHFETDKAVIMPESFELCRQVARVILEHPEILKLRIEGHADSRGSDEYNLDLSTRRAKAVLDFLVEAGVSPVRVNSVGYGEAKPLVAEETEEAWAQNRRVEFWIEERAD